MASQNPAPLMADVLAQESIKKTVNIRGHRNPVLPMAVTFNTQNLRQSIDARDCMLKPLSMDEGIRLETDYKYKGAPIPIPGELVNVPIITDLDNIKEVSSLALGCFLSLFGTEGAGQQTGIYIDTAATLVVNLLRPDARAELKDSLAYKAYTLVYQELTFDEYHGRILKHIIEDVEWDSRYRDLRDSEPTHLFGVTAICLGLPLIFIGKQISLLCSYIHTYFVTRYKTLNSETGAVSASAYFETEHIIPDKARCIEFNKTIAGVFEFRRVITECLQSCASHKGLYQPVSKVVLRYLRYSEMTHIELINTQLLVRCPEAFGMSCIQKEQAALDAAHTFLRSIPVENRPYTKLMRPQEACRPILSQNFYFMTAAVHIIAGFFNKSYDNYKGTSNEIVEKMQTSLVKCNIK